jgi:hypothetical protein
MSDDGGDVEMQNGNSDRFDHEIAENEGLGTADQGVNKEPRRDFEDEEEEEEAAYDDEEEDEEEDEEDLDSERPKKKSKVCASCQHMILH